MTYSLNVNISLPMMEHVLGKAFEFVESQVLLILKKG